MKLFDISQEVFGCAVFPGDPAPERQVLLRIPNGNVCNLTAFSMCAHNGTHVDAPFHFIDDGRTIEQVDLEAFVGDCWVTTVDGEVTAKTAEAVLRRAKEEKPGAERRILFRGRAVVTEEAASVFAREGALLVGNESQTVGPEDAPAAVHRILLGAGVVLLEGIRLEHVPEGAYFLNAAPLNLGGSDGAPCRAILLAL